MNSEEGNQTTPVEFILLDFNIKELQILLFMLFLPIYLSTMMGNILLVVLVSMDQHLHTPMYFFLGNLSFLETCYSSTILPRMLIRFLTGIQSISISGCIAQMYFFGFLATTECYLLAVMSYDRYLAICRPLYYAILMNDRICVLLIAVSWILGALKLGFVIFLVSQLTFCGPNQINHFFCDFTPVVRLSCDDTYLVKMAVMILSSIGTLVPLFIIVTSYFSIIKSIWRIPSTIGKQKAFSTCSSHIIVVSCFYGSLMIVYVLPNNNSMREVKKVFSMFYTLLTPLVNPLIYSLRNKEVKEAMQKTFKILPIRK
ncbi:olfactory receptor 11L1-like [Paroedura picta]|uniref:olfactory receptor 11L1-like n=1 Tax=Paroedura picta TaxID=143630 RepID=UPI004055FEB9